MTLQLGIFGDVLLILNLNEPGDRTTPAFDVLEASKPRIATKTMKYGHRLFSTLSTSGQSLAGKRALITGVASRESVAFGCARAFQRAGADLAITFAPKSEKYVRPLAEELGARLCLPLDVRDDAMMQHAADACANEWAGQLDILLHSVAFCNRDDLVRCPRSLSLIFRSVCRDSTHPSPSVRAKDFSR